MLQSRRPADDRLAWVDATRGACVVGVVLFHVCLWWFLPLVAEPGAMSERLWGALNGVLGSVRMPLLLAVSGLVAARRVRIGLGDTALLTRAATNGYLYVVWLVVYLLAYTVLRGDLPHRVDGPLDAATDLVNPETTLWYLYALPLYTLLLAAVRRVPPGIVLAALAVVSVGSRVLLDPGDSMWPRILELAFFFALGVHGAPVLRAFAARVTVVRAAACAALALLVTLGGRVSDAEAYRGLLFLVRGTAFLLTAVALVVLLVRWAPVRRVAQAVGRRTLAVYVLHVLLIAVLIVATGTWGQGVVGAALGVPAVAVVLPVLATAAVVAGCLVAESALRAVGLVSLFEMPGRLRAAVRHRVPTT